MASQKINFYLIFILTTTLSLLASVAPASNNRCEALDIFFDNLVHAIISSDLRKGIKVQLCSRTASSNRHLERERPEKAKKELEKLIEALENPSINDAHAQQLDLIRTEATFLISSIQGSDDYAKNRTISGRVAYFLHEQAAANSIVTLFFPESDVTRTTITDNNGYFYFDNLENAGIFLIYATDESGASGSGSSSLADRDSITLNLFLDYPGEGSISGIVSSNYDRESGVGFILSIVYPDTGRTAATLSGTQGNYSFDALPVEGTVIVTAFDSINGFAASMSDALTSWEPSIAIDLDIEAPEIVHTEIFNAGFSEGLDGWSTEGQALIIDRDVYFTNN